MKYLSILILSLFFVGSSCTTETENKNSETPVVQPPTPTVSTEQSPPASTPETPVQTAQTNTTFNVKQYFEKIKTVDNCLGEGESFEVLGRRLDAVIKLPLNTVETPSDLKDLFYNAIERRAATAAPANKRCADTNEAVKVRALQRLGGMANEAAAEVLMDLYKDKNLLFAGGDGRNLSAAMISCGSSILPLLKPIKDQRPQVSTAVLSALKG